MFSFFRKASSFLSEHGISFFQEKHDQNKKSSFHEESHILSKFSQLPIAPFAILVFLQQLIATNAEKIYPLELSTNTEYRIDYNRSDFPGMQSSLIKYCGAILSSIPKAIYEHTTSPQCMSAEGKLGPAIDLGIEIGKNLTHSFQSCLNYVMLQLCNDYDNKNDELFKIIAFACIVGLVCVCWCGLNSHTHASDSGLIAPILYIDSGNSSSGNHNANASVVWHP